MAYVPCRAATARYLSFSGNAIVSIDADAFWPLKVIHTLDLGRNPLLCDLGIPGNNNRPLQAITITITGNSNCTCPREIQSKRVELVMPSVVMPSVHKFSSDEAATQSRIANRTANKIANASCQEVVFDLKITGQRTRTGGAFTSYSTTDRYVRCPPVRCM